MLSYKKPVLFLLKNENASSGWGVVQSYKRTHNIRFLGLFGFYSNGNNECNRNELGRQLILSTWRPLKFDRQRDLGSCRLLHLILWGSTKKGHWSFLQHFANYWNAEKRQNPLGSIVWMVGKNNQSELLSLEIWFRRLSLKLGRSQDVGSVRYLLHFNAEALETV